MKRTFILTAFTALAAGLLLASCGPSRVYATHERQDRYPPPPPPRYNHYVSLIISPTPGFTMNRHANGRYFHRSPQGFLYWKGYDNRFYLDRAYINRVQYDRWEYNQWKRYSRGRR